jgi:hypothetical protein
MANATSFKFYHDSSLTSEITSENPLDGDGDNLIYFGSTATGTQIQMVSDPGVDYIIVDIVDSDGGSGSPDTEFKLALSSGGLDTATAGASLTLSTTVTSGVANKVPIYTRRTTAITTAGTYTDLSFSVGPVIETAV